MKFMSEYISTFSFKKIVYWNKWIGNNNGEIRWLGIPWSSDFIGKINSINIWYVYDSWYENILSGKQILNYL